MARARPPVPSTPPKAPTARPEALSRPEFTLIEGQRPSRGGPPERAEESYRPEENNLTEADKDMIDFLIDQAIEAWRRSH